MKRLQNTLYVTTPEAYLSLDGETVVVRNDDDVLGRVPLHNLEAIVSFGYRGVSPALMRACTERNIGLCFLSRHGRFLAAFPVLCRAMSCCEPNNIAPPMTANVPCRSQKCS